MLLLLLLFCIRVEALVVKSWSAAAGGILVPDLDATVSGELSLVIDCSKYFVLAGCFLAFLKALDITFRFTQTTLQRNPLVPCLFYFP